MRKIWIVVLVLVSNALNAQTITTIAGSGSGGDGFPASVASVFDPNGLAIDSHGNIYFSQNLNHRIRKIDTAGIISTIAGIGSPGFSGDGGLAVSAMLNQPCGITVDSFDNIYIADAQNYRIRKITISTGIISTIVGNSTAGFAGDGGLATAATINRPSAVCFDKIGNLYIGDAVDSRVRKVNTSGIINTVAGNGLVGSDGDGGPATNAKCTPFMLCTDKKDNLYIACAGTGLGTIRRIDKNGIITTIAGNTSTYIYNGDGIQATNATLDPCYLIFDKTGKLYVSDAYNDRIRVIDTFGIIHTLCGTGIGGYTGDGGTAVLAKIDNPSGLVFDQCGNLSFGQVNTPRIRKITFNPPPCDYLSITQQNTPSEVLIYPNPANDIINIDNLPTETNYSIRNLEGIAIQHGILQTGNSSIPLQSLSSGMYMLVLIDEQGRRTVNKIVRQ